MARSANFSLDTLGPLIVWQFIIPYAATWMQSILYSIFIRAGEPKPMPGSPRFVKHRRQILIVTYLAYFLFTIYEADYNLQRAGNVYNDLGVPIDVSDSVVNSRFRRLTLKYHPDKVALKDQARATDFYNSLKSAKDVILDPAKRWAYDRFGPSIFYSVPKALTIKEYLDSQLFVALFTYGALLLFLIGTNALGFFRDGAYWRYLAILAVASYDIRTAMRPDHPAFLTHWLNPLVTSLHLRPAYLPFQITSILKKAALSAAQFLGLIIPLYRDDPLQPAKATVDTDEARHKQLDRLEAAVQAGNADVSRILELEATIFKENERAKGELRKAMTAYMVQNVVRQEPEVRDAIGRRIARRREAPHGAVGTR